MKYRTNPERPIPRQTLANWRRRLRGLCDAIVDPAEPEELCSSSLHEPLSPHLAPCSRSTSPSLSEPMAVCSSGRSSPSLSQTMESLSLSPDSCSSIPDDDIMSPPYSSLVSDCGEPLLYPGAQITEQTGIHLIQSLALRHGFTQAALGDMLKVIGLHLPAAHGIPASYKSAHRLLQASKMRPHLEKLHILCSDCGELIKEEEQTNDDCIHSNIVKFYEYPIDVQIQDLFIGITTIYNICL